MTDMRLAAICSLATALSLLTLDAQPPSAAALRAAEGLQALEAGKWDAAAAAFAEARRLEPENINYSLGLAQAQLSAGRPLLAIPLLRECVRRLPAAADVRFALAQAYLGAEKDAEAAQVLAAKPPPDPLQTPWLFHRAFALFRLNDYAAALPIFEDLVRRAAGMRAPGEFFAANCLAAMGRLDESLPRYERAIAAGSRPDNRALNAYFYNYGLALFRLARYQDAIRQFQASLRLYGIDPMPHFLLGRSLAALQQFPEAIAAMETAVKLAPDFASGHYVLAQLLHNHGDKQRAAALFSKVAQLNKRDLERSMQAAMRMKTAWPDKALGTADLR